MMKRWPAAFIAYVAITCALTYPLITMLGSVLPNDPGDPALNTWILWWNAHAVPDQGPVTTKTGIPFFGLSPQKG